MIQVSDVCIHENVTFTQKCQLFDVSQIVAHFVIEQMPRRSKIYCSDKITFCSLSRARSLALAIPVRGSPPANGERGNERSPLSLCEPR